MGLIRMYEISTRNKNNKKKASENFRPESLQSEKKKITKWTQKQNGNYNGNNKERKDLKGLVYVHLKFQKK